MDTLEGMIELTPDESRVLGVLIEMATTTPEQYPLSLTAEESKWSRKLLSPRTLASRAFYFLATALALDLSSSVASAAADRSSELIAIVALYYGAWISWSILTARRIIHGKGRVCGAALLIALLVAVSLGIAISLGLGVNDYHPPRIVWITHRVLLVSYLAAVICLVRSPSSAD